MALLETGVPKSAQVIDFACSLQDRVIEFRRMAAPGPANPDDPIIHIPIQVQLQPHENEFLEEAKARLGAIALDAACLALMILCLGTTRRLLALWIGENARFWDSVKVSYVFDSGEFVAILIFVWNMMKTGVFGIKD